MPKISFWRCEYGECDEYWNEDDVFYVYICTHPDNKENYCDLDNKYNDDEDECDLITSSSA